MPDIDTPTSDALIAASTDGIVSRDAVTFFAKDRSTGEEQVFAFWVGEDTVTADVMDGDTGNTVSRDFVGVGGENPGQPLISVGDVPNTNDLTIRRVPVALNQIHAVVQEMFRGYDIRLVRAEVHRLLFAPATRNLVGLPPCHFIGQVNVAPLSTPAAGDEGAINIDIVSDTQEMTRTNPAKMSNQTMIRRTSGDTMLQYASQLAAGVDLPWGEATIS